MNKYKLCILLKLKKKNGKMINQNDKITDFILIMEHDVLIDVVVHLESFINDENDNNFGINIFRILLLIFIRVKFECRAIV